MIVIPAIETSIFEPMDATRESNSISCISTSNPSSSPIAFIKAMSKPSGFPSSPIYSKGGKAAFVPTTSFPSCNNSCEPDAFATVFSLPHAHILKPQNIVIIRAIILFFICFFSSFLNSSFFSGKIKKQAKKKSLSALTSIF